MHWEPEMRPLWKRLIIIAIAFLAAIGQSSVGFAAMTPAQRFLRDFGLNGFNQSNAALILILVVLAGVVLTLLIWVASLWGIFKKAGEPGWIALVPLLNIFTLMRIANMPSWSLLVLFVPAVGGIWGVWLSYALAREFGKSRFYMLGLIIAPFIFYPHLAFGKSQYRRQFGTGKIPYRMIA